MSLIQAICPNHITLRVGKQGVRSAEVGALDSVLEKSATELELKLKFKPKLLRGKTIVRQLMLGL